MKTKLLLLSLIFLSATGLIGVLYALSFRPNSVPNGFRRKFDKETVVGEKHVELAFLDKQDYLAGIDGKRVYVAGKQRPVDVYSVDTKTNKVTHIQISDVPDTIGFFNPSLFIHKADFYLIDGNRRKVCSGKISDWTVNKVRQDSTLYEYALPTFKSDRFIYRTIDKKNGFILGERSAVQKGLYVNLDLLTKQIDGTFSKDGMLLFDQDSQKVVYVYYYRNEIVVADTALNLLYRSKTIDTISRAVIKLTTAAKKGTVKMAIPPFVVNKKAATGNGRLYVNSALLADNEDRKAFDQNAVIDVYDLKDGHYLRSFYLPDTGHEKMLSLAVKDNTLVALYKNGLGIYQLKDF